MKTSFIADVNSDFLNFSERQLTLLGYQVSAFKSTSELLKSLKHKPTLIIIGELSDGMNAIETIRSIRKELPETIIFHVGQTGPYVDAVSSIKAGATEFIEKNSATFVRLRSSLDFVEKQKQGSSRSFLRDIKRVFIG